MKKNSFAIAALILVAASPVEAKGPPPQPPRPAVEPDWAQVRQESEAALTSGLFDPASAQVEWRTGFEWAYFKPVLQKRIFGWVGCGVINAKNRMGGYVGATQFVVVYDGGVRYKEIGDSQYGVMGAGCVAVPPQAALKNMPAVAQAGAGSVADELAKLAALKSNGVITEAEFEAQKAKLLEE